LTRGDGSALNVSGKPYDVLVYLVQHAGELVHRNALLEGIWPKRVVEDNNLTQAIAVLRRALGDQHIATVAGSGYQFVTPVRVVTLEQASEPIGPTSETSALALHDSRELGADASHTPPAPAQEHRLLTSRSGFAWSALARASKKFRYAVPALLVLTVAFLAIDRYQPARRSTTGRIAVLPCNNLSPDPNDSYLAAGIHDELVTRLAQIRTLRVISRSSMLRYSDERPPIPQLGAELGVQMIMECGVRSSGDEMLLTVQLIDTATDEHLWAQSYRGDMSDLHSLYEAQADIAANVTNALRLELADVAREQIAEAPTESKEAYELYLAALSTPRAERAIELLDQALELDSEFVAAWIKKAWLHEFVAGLKTREESDADLTATLDAVNRALEIDPDSASAHAMRGLYFTQTGDFIGAQLESNRAISLGSADAPVLLKLAVGHVPEAVAALEAALVDDPLNQLAATLLLFAYEILGDRQARRRLGERGETLFDSPWIGDVAEPVLRLGENDTEYLRTATMPSPALTTIWRAGLANLDSPADGLAAMQSLHENPELRTATDLRFMTAWALYFGDPALALLWFREAVELQASSMLHAWLPSFTELRREPEFTDLVRDQKLPEYWNRFGWPTFCRPLEGDDFECD
jgi:TolB-like protein/DNA-binding winged helix-turn-helix (wHTH) protein